MPRLIFGKEYYNIPEIAKILGLTEVTVRVYYAEGRMKGVKLGNAWYSTQEEIETFLSTKTLLKNKRNK